MKNLIISCAAIALVAGASADTLSINNPLNDQNSITAQITDTADGVNVDAYVGSLNGSLFDGVNTTPLPYFYCVDILDDIYIPTSYDVTVESVNNATAWLIDHEYSPSMSYAQDAGLQMAIWAVTFPGVTFSNVSDPDAVTYMNEDLAADDYGAYTAAGTEFVHVGNYGQNMEIANPGHTPSVPGPIALLPFAVGVLARRRRNA